MLKIADIKPYEKNAKKHPKNQVEKIANSIKRFGFAQPVVVDSNNVCIIGHGRIEASKLLKLNEVPTLMMDNLSEDEVKALRLADNRLNESDWDMGLVLEELKGLDLDLALTTGFERDIFDTVVEDDFDPEVKPEPKAQLGDIYQLGEHRLMCGDSTKKEDVDRLMNKNRVQMVWTDPPYNIAYERSMNSNGQNKGDIIKNDNMSSESFYTFLLSAVRNMLDFCDGAVYICMSSSELVNLKNAFDNAGGHFQSFIIWAKNTFTLSRSDWQCQYEPILYGWNKEVVHHYFVGHRNIGNLWESFDTIKPSFEDGKTKIKIGEYHLELDGQVTGKIINKTDQTDLWKEKKPTKSKEHPTMKPIKLVCRALKASSERGDCVLDLFAGGAVQ